MSEQVTILGYGAIGQAVAERLSEAGRPMVICQRSSVSHLPPGATFKRCDATDPRSVAEACKGSGTVILAIGLPYDRKVWTSKWPLIMRGVLDGATQSGARLVFVDNLYMYGPQTEPLVESMPLTDFGHKPRVRSEITRLWQDAHAAGRVRATAVRGADFYGPGALDISRLGTSGIGRVVEGKPAQTIDPLDTPHDFTFTGDFARAVETLIDAPDDAFGEAWHVPNAGPTHTLRELLELAAKQAEKPLTLQPLPRWLQGVASLFMPALGEIKEMRFQWDAPYHVNSEKFASRFWSDATPYESGIELTVEAFQRRLRNS